MDICDVHQPLVSCLMVTKPTPGRLAGLRTSVSDFCRQTYANRELVIVMDHAADGSQAAIRAAVGALNRPDIRMVAPGTALTLGALRNRSVREADGALICQWDDDDRYHPDRITNQVSAMHDAGCQSVFLQEVMHFYPAQRRLFLMNWRATPAGAKPATLLCVRSLAFRYPEDGPHARSGEDLDVLLQLRALGGSLSLAGQPHLYVYQSHGSNTTSDAFRQMLNDRLAVSKGLLRRREADLRRGLAPFGFGAGALEVHGSNGLAFVMADC